MPAKKYIVSLTPEERTELEQLVNTGKAPAYQINHARILLKADWCGWSLGKPFPRKRSDRPSKKRAQALVK